MTVTTKGELKYIPLKSVRENPVALRPVNKQTEEYNELVDSVRVHGILNPILVRPMKDEETGETYYSLIDGLHRRTAAADAGLTEVPAQIKDADDALVLYQQVVANLMKTETLHAQYARQLVLILSNDPTMTLATLASRLGKSVTWVIDRLSLTKLDKPLQELVDKGDLNLSNAFALAKLPVEEQTNFLDRALTMTPQEFSGVVQNRKKELDKAKRRGEDAPAEAFVAPVHCRKMAEIKDELSASKIGPTLVRTQLDLEALQTKGEVAEAAFALAVKWMLHQDAASVEAAKNKDDQRKAALADAREKAKKANVETRAADAAVKAARLKIEADAVKSGKPEDEVKAELAAFDAANGLVDGKKPPKAEAAPAAAK